MWCLRVKQQAWGKGKNMRCPGSTPLSGGGHSSCSRIWAASRSHRGAPWSHKGKGTKWLFCRSHRSSSWQGLVPQRWHKACYLTKCSRTLEQTCFNGPGEGCSSLHRMGPPKLRTLVLWFHWCRFRSNDKYFKALKKVFCLSLKVMPINGVKIVLWVNQGLFLLAFFKARIKELIFFFFLPLFHSCYSDILKKKQQDL